MDYDVVHKEHILTLCDSGCSHSMIKGSLIDKYKSLFCDKDEATYMTVAGSFVSKHSMEVTLLRDEFSGNEKTNPFKLYFHHSSN